jgi:hypothetical protein
MNIDVAQASLDCHVQTLARDVVAGAAMLLLVAQAARPSRQIEVCVRHYCGRRNLAVTCTHKIIRINQPAVQRIRILVKALRAAVTRIDCATEGAVLKRSLCIVAYEGNGSRARDETGTADGLRFLEAVIAI